MISHSLGTDPVWADVNKILCVRLDSMGDVLMTTPAIKALRAGCPSCEITLLTSPAGARIASLIPEIDDVVVYESPWMKATPTRQDSVYDHYMIETLRAGGYDAAVIFTVFSQNPLPAAMLAYLADIPLRLAHCRENPYQLLTHWAREKDLDADKGIRHEVQRHLDLVAMVGYTTPDMRMSVSVPPAALEKVLTRLRGLDIDLAAPWVVVHPGASAPSRRYPASSFAKVVHRLVKDHDFQVILTGSSEEVDLVEKIRSEAQVPCISLAGRLDLEELAALLSLAPLMISNNTGPAHLAAAAGTPVVDLYALTNPQHTPWGVPNRVLNYDVPCKNCYKSICPLKHHNCLRRVEPAEVVAAAVELYQEARAASARQEAL